MRQITLSNHFHFILTYAMFNFCEIYAKAPELNILICFVTSFFLDYPNIIMHRMLIGILLSRWSYYTLTFLNLLMLNKGNKLGSRKSGLKHKHFLSNCTFYNIQLFSKLFTIFIIYKLPLNVVSLDWKISISNKNNKGSSPTTLNICVSEGL